MTTEMIVTGFGAVVVLLLTLAGFLFNRWMENHERRIDKVCSSLDKLWKHHNRHGHKIVGCKGGGYETDGVIVEADA
jgi:hypothetical protein